MCRHSQQSINRWPKGTRLSNQIQKEVANILRPTHSQPQSGEERWEARDEPTRLERIIASQFRRGIPVALTPKEQQDLLKMSLEQRCDYTAKIIVWTSRGIEKHIRETEK
jgi:hypothetical protein